MAAAGGLTSAVGSLVAARAHLEAEVRVRKLEEGIPGWRSGLAPAFGPGCDPGDPGSSPTSGSRGMEPASPSACLSLSVSLSL